MATVSIPLANNKGFALIDEEDYPLVSQYKWHHNSGHAATMVRVDGGQRGLSLHRLLMNPPSGIDVDHRNGVGTDCRRENMRLATRAQNTRNKRIQKNNKSGFKGVYWVESKKKWLASIRAEGRVYLLGRFDTPHEAAIAYDMNARQLHGEFARLNFPDACVQLPLSFAPSRPHRKTSHSVGVYFDKSKNRWKSEIIRGGQRYRLGYFHTEADAAKAYQEKAEELSRQSA